MKIKVAVKKADREVLEIKEIESSLACLQKEVGGNIEAVGLNLRLQERNVVAYGNEEAKLLHLNSNFWIYDKKDVFCGDAVFVRTDEEGEDISLEAEDIQLIEEFLAKNKMTTLEKIITHEAIKRGF